MACRVIWHSQPWRFGSRATSVPPATQVARKAVSAFSTPSPRCMVGTRTIQTSPKIARVINNALFENMRNLSQKQSDFRGLVHLSDQNGNAVVIETLSAFLRSRMTNVSGKNSGVRLLSELILYSSDKKAFEALIGLMQNNQDDSVLAFYVSRALVEIVVKENEFSQRAFDAILDVIRNEKTEKCWINALIRELPNVIANSNKYGEEALEALFERAQTESISMSDPAREALAEVVIQGSVLSEVAFKKLQALPSSIPIEVFHTIVKKSEKLDLASRAMQELFQFCRNENASDFAFWALENLATTRNEGRAYDALMGIFSFLNDSDCSQATFRQAIKITKSIALHSGSEYQDKAGEQLLFILRDEKHPLQLREEVTEMYARHLISKGKEGAEQALYLINGKQANISLSLRIAILGTYLSDAESKYGKQETAELIAQVASDCVSTEMQHEALRALERIGEKGGENSRFALKTLYQLGKRAAGLQAEIEGVPEPEASSGLIG